LSVTVVHYCHQNYLCILLNILFLNFSHLRNIPEKVLDFSFPGKCSFLHIHLYRLLFESAVDFFFHFVVKYHPYSFVVGKQQMIVAGNDVPHTIPLWNKDRERFRRVKWGQKKMFGDEFFFYFPFVKQPFSKKVFLHRHAPGADIRPRSRECPLRRGHVTPDAVQQLQTWPGIAVRLQPSVHGGKRDIGQVIYIIYVFEICVFTFRIARYADVRKIIKNIFLR